MRGFPLCLLLVFVGCDDHIIGELRPATATDEAEIGEGWCAVQTLLTEQCHSCHSAARAVADLDLATTPFETLTTWVSPTYGEVLVTASDPSRSLLLRKLEGDLGYGGMMPPSGFVGDALFGEVQQWVAEGATPGCDEPPPTPEGRYHPVGWSEPTRHGIGAKLQQDDCTSCHGETLQGGDVGIACSDCHDDVVDDWTTACTFCHGDDEDGSGAPPEDIDDNDDPATISFPAHRLHLSSDTHADWDCTQCHTVPTTVFSTGHLFVGDATAGRAELTFGAGLAPAASSSPTGCSNVYCHGDGQSNGDVSRTESVACGDCHGIQSRPALWGSLSFAHEKHLDEGVRCVECHPNVNPSDEITDKELHVDGEVALSLPEGMTYLGDLRCTGTCHDEPHQFRWTDDD
ncbi:MAG: hypothetical protein KTR31_16315 [Myxococcales bacterium]|nr:hypothetical protein [Myxococcales bacterium]